MKNNPRDSKFLKALGAPLLMLYKTVVLLKVIFYRKGILKSVKVPVPVISVGNISMGGSGKTPFVIYLCSKLISRNIHPVVLTRGYGRRDENEEIVIPPGGKRIPDPAVTGDEAALLALKLPEVPVICSADRVSAAQTAIDKFKPDVLILDDGFQHLRLYRDIDIALIPPEKQYWNREFRFGINRADIIISPKNRQWKKSNQPEFTITRKPGNAVSIKGNKRLNLKALKGKKCAAVAGIAAPEPFFHMLEEAGIIIILRKSLKDHAPYSQEQIHEYETAAERSGCDYILTTEKDSVKIRKLDFDSNKWYAVALDIDIDDSDTLLDRIVDILGLVNRSK